MAVNLTQLRYAVEVEKARSISKAAESLYIGQPNVSRAIRELEETVGITIFNRSSRGITPTPEGEVFLSYAKGIIDKVGELESIYNMPSERRKRFYVSAPRASYISKAFSMLISDGILDGIEVHFKETNAGHAISNITDDDYNLAIVRFMSEYSAKFKELMDEKGLKCEDIWEFERVILVSGKNPAAALESISQPLLNQMNEVFNSDYYTPPLTVSADRNESPNNRMYIFERASRLELLGNTANTYMWSAPESDEVLKRYGLVALKPEMPVKKYKDVVIYKKNYRLTSVDEMFLKLVRRMKTN